MDESLTALAQAAGLSPRWRDYRGDEHAVSAQTLTRVLGALGLPAESREQIAASTQRLTDEASSDALPPMMVAQVEVPMPLPVPAGTLLRIDYENGDSAICSAITHGTGTALAGISAPGYHRLHIDGRTVTLAVAPKHCIGVNDLAPNMRLWAIAAQQYSLRGANNDGGYGDFGALAEFVCAAGSAGADAVCISPLHALYAADGSRFSPYAPSSRLFLNTAYADPSAIFGADAVNALIDQLDQRKLYAELHAQPLIDWPAASAARYALLRAAHGRFGRGLASDDDVSARAFQAFLAHSGQPLIDHARFEALHQHFGGADWREWPRELHDARGAAVTEFARAHADEVEFHLFAQWLAAAGLARAQHAARDAGMRIGLIADLAIGTDPRGSDAWSHGDDLLDGLTVGAPPDLLNARGQDWGLTALSPRSLRAHGYAPFIATLRASLRHAGGLRIDHVLGLSRLWLVPRGGDARDGVYLTYPFEDLLRLVALESWRHRALIIGEDLGTVPEGFRDHLAAAGVLGMQVLWFERDHRYFIAPARWRNNAAAMTTTHDLPTLAGWWSGRDVAWNEQLQRSADPRGEQAARVDDRQTLWNAAVHADVADGPAPAPEAPVAAVDAALAFVARTPAPLLIVPVEDLLGLAEQPNIPGTTDEHPNWRQRLPDTATLFATPAVQRRVALIQRARDQT